MNLADELKKIVSSVDGAMGAVLMGFDGIVVSDYKSDQAVEPLMEVAVEYSRLIKETIKVAQGNDLGELKELVVSTAKYRMIFRLVNMEYFLGLFLADTANVGKGRFILIRASPLITEIL